MKKLLFFMMVIGIEYMAPVYAAQQPGLRTTLARDEQVESIRGVQEQIKKKHALHKILERAGMHKEAENLEREISGLEEQLKEMEAQEGDWSGFSTYDEAEDTSIAPPKMSARLSQQEREALFSGRGEQESGIRAPLSDIEDQLITEYEAEFPGLREALERSMFERGPAQEAAAEPRAAAAQEEEKKTAMEEAQEEMKQAQSKPKKIKKKLSPREREVSAFLPIDLAGMVADYDVGYLWLDPLAQPIAQKLKWYKEDRVYSMAISEDGQFIVTGNFHDFTRVWRKDGKGEWQSVRELKQIEGGTPGVVAISADGQFIMTKARKSVLVWGKDGGESWPFVQELEHTENITSFALSADDQFMVVGTLDGARVWRRDGKGDWQSVQELERRTELKRGDDIVRGVAISADGRFIVTMFGDGTNRIVRIWAKNDRKGWQLAQEIKGDDYIYSVAMSSDGQFIVTGSRRMSRVWNKSGKGTGDWQAAQELEGVVHSVVISMDGRFIVTGSNDGIVRIWGKDDKEHWKSVKSFSVHETDTTIKLAISADGQFIVTLDGVGVRVWHAVLPPEQDLAKRPIKVVQTVLSPEQDLDRQLIEVVQRKLPKGSPETARDRGRMLAQIQQLVKDGANPDVMVPSDGGGQQALWQVAEINFGKNHVVTRHLKRISRRNK